MSEWEYRKIDLKQQPPRSDELDMLNTCGADGWEFVAITSLTEDIRNQFCEMFVRQGPHCPNMSRMPCRLSQILAEELGLYRWSKQSQGAICLRTPSWDRTNFAFCTRHLTGPGNFSNRNIMPARRQ